MPVQTDARFVDHLPANVAVQFLDRVRAAADAERARLAFGEAAAHLARARHAVEDTEVAGSGAVLVDLLVEEADARARTGDPLAARRLLEDARDRAVTLEDPARLGPNAGTSNQSIRGFLLRVGPQGLPGTVLWLACIAVVGVIGFQLARRAYRAGDSVSEVAVGASTRP